MRREQMESLLMTTTAEQPRVSDRLHQDIMRRVRQADPVARKASIDWRIPVFGTAMSLLVFYTIQSVDVQRMPPAERGLPEGLLGDASLAALKDQLTTLSERPSIVEDELKQELERLKSDLRRFDFRS